MKKILILLILTAIALQAQDKDPNPWHFEWGSSSSLRTFVQDSFPQTSFFTGFQWSGSTKMDNALGNNSKTGKYYQVASTTVLKPINWLFQPTWFDSTNYVPGYYGAVMMQYEPTLPINSTNEGNILRPDDPTICIKKSLLFVS